MHPGFLVWSLPFFDVPPSRIGSALLLGWAGWLVGWLALAGSLARSFGCLRLGCSDGFSKIVIPPALSMDYYYSYSLKVTYHILACPPTKPTKYLWKSYKTNLFTHHPAALVAGPLFYSLLLSCGSPNSPNRTILLPL